MSNTHARSAANPYPEIVIGDGKNDNSNGLVKRINESHNYVKDTLNPDFFTFYELDSFVPFDWKCVIRIWNHGVSDSFIGQKIFDLEDRYFGNPKVQLKLAKKKRLDYLVEAQKTLKNKKDDNGEINEEGKDKIGDMMGEIENKLTI